MKDRRKNNRYCARKALLLGTIARLHKQRQLDKALIFGWGNPDKMVARKIMTFGEFKKTARHTEKGTYYG